MTSLIGLLEGNPSAKEILSTFKDYGESGAAVSSNSVIAIVEKANLSYDELTTAYNHLKKGYDLHKGWAESKGSEKTEAEKYLDSMMYVAGKVVKGYMEGKYSIETMGNDRLNPKKFQVIADYVLGINRRIQGLLEYPRHQSDVKKLREEAFSILDRLPQADQDMIMKAAIAASVTIEIGGITIGIGKKEM